MTTKLLFLVNEGAFFCSHRLPLALAAKAAGYEVIVVTHAGHHRDRILAAGLQLIAIPVFRSKRIFSFSINLHTLIKLIGIYKKHKPDIIHHVALKSIVLGSMAAFAARSPRMINTFTGLGFLYTSEALSVRLIRCAVVEPLLRWLLNRKNTWALLQNRDDRALLLSRRMIPESRTVVIRGSGVDIDAFPYAPEPDGRPLVVFASRMLRDKGVCEFVAAAESLIRRGVDARFVLAGDVDAENPRSLSREYLQERQQAGGVEWWGHREDIQALFAKAHVVCLPSHYREGLPKVLLEAAASGRAIVTTDTPGCREIVQDGVNGLLAPVKDAPSLAKAIEKLLNDRALRQQMGVRGRRMVEEHFSQDIVNSQTLALYRRALEKR